MVKFNGYAWAVRHKVYPFFVDYFSAIKYNKLKTQKQERDIMEKKFFNHIIHGGTLSGEITLPVCGYLILE